MEETLEPIVPDPQDTAVVLVRFDGNDVVIEIVPLDDESTDT